MHVAVKMDQQTAVLIDFVQTSAACEDRRLFSVTI